MKVFGIAAVGRSGQLGFEGRLPWHDREDLLFFKLSTVGKDCIVGHKTHQTLPPLPGRRVHIDRIELTPREMLESVLADEVWIIGGAKTYERYRPLIRRWFITMTDYDGPADAHMPPLWQLGMYA